jgi:PAS domain S-box-containing protein
MPVGESKYRAVLELSPGWIWEMDRHGVFTFSTPGVTAILGYAVEQILGRPAAHLLQAEDRRRFADDISRRVAQGLGWRGMNLRWRHREGGCRTLESDANPVLDRDGRCNGFVGVARDITERVAAEERLRSSELWFRSVTQGSSDIIVVLDAQGRTIYESPSTAKALGFPPGHLLGRSPMVVVHPEDAARIAQDLREVALGTNPGIASVFRCRRADGSWIHLEAVGSNQLGDPAVGGIVLTARDITERKRAEEALLAERQQLIDIVDFLPDATLVVDQDHRVVAWNRAAEAMTGVGREELLGRGDYAYAVPFFGERRPILIDLLDAPDEERERVYKTVSRSGGKIFAESFVPSMYGGAGAHLWGVAAALYDRGGKRTGAIEVIRDVTEFQRTQAEAIALQRRLMQSQKMEAVGRLAGGVAHDFNNMLAAILGHAELAKLKCPAGDPLQPHLALIEQAARRSADLVRQLLAFARRQTVTPRVIDVNDRVSGMRDMLQRMVGEEIEIAWLPAEDLWPVRIDPSQVDQILTNLCVNARDAMAGPGRIAIETGNAAFDAAYCALHPGFAPGEYARLTVSDQGCGMGHETLQQIFEPFFTTKESGRGTGLGLATVYGIVKQNEGFINVTSEPGRGTTVRIYLPRASGEPVAPSGQGGEEIPPGSGEVLLLLVEDEAINLDLGRELLQRLRYTVLCAATPDEAIALARAHAGQIALLITDVVMPVMSGRELADRLLARQPGLKVLFTSGYTANAIAHRGVLDAGLHFIHKPFSLRDLAVKVQAVLAE